MTIPPIIAGTSHGGGRGPGNRVRACALAITTAAAVALICGCGAAQVPAGGTPGSGRAVTPGSASAATPEPSNAVTPAVTLPPGGVMSATQACRLVIRQERRGFFTRIERVHLVLTTYAKGEPIESHGDISAGMATSALVWVVEVHAQSINWDHSVAPQVSASTGASAPAEPVDTDFSVVISARTGDGSDAAECNCWPLPLGQAGTLISLPAGC